MRIPEPEIVNPDSVPSLKWGIIGPGVIANAFVKTCLENTNQVFSAVASRTFGRAEEFAKKYSIEKNYLNYEQLVEDKHLDAIYISSWQGDHFEHVMLALRAGKHVLVEKPITYSPQQAQEIFDFASMQGLLVMEAMWTRYLPQSTIIRKLLSEGDLGKPELFSASFCVDNRQISRLWQKGGGGIIYDMGIYPIAMAQQFLGNPTKITASGKVNSEGLDEETFAVLEYESGARAQITSSGISTLPTKASCSFEKGVLVVDEPFFVPSGLKLRDKDLYFKQVSWRDESSIQGHDGLCYQATWFAKYVSEGRVESPVHTAKDTVANIDVAHQISVLVGAKPF